MVLTTEREEVSIGEKSIHPSKKLTAILKAIDKIKFDDNKDVFIFPSLIESYEDLSAVQMERVEAGVARVPLFLKLLFVVLNIGYISLENAKKVYFGLKTRELRLPKLLKLKVHRPLGY